ncbi:MAG: DUF3881 family protein [Lachnospiraceae bacterium]|nr:DUF3881 family protein [Lachnospiraceae bacterium]
MHAYLKSAGFSEITKKADLKRLLQDVVEHYDRKKTVEDEEHRLFVEISKEYAYDCGITVCGEMDEQDVFQMEYYYPFFNGGNVTSQEDISIDRHSDKESFAGACDDYRVGITLIFYLLNAAEYIAAQGPNKLRDPRTSLTLSALARDGCILLPIYKNREEKQEESSMQQRSAMIAAARNGDEEALESLTMEDIDTYTSISKRINQKEDVFSIVETSFMPYGMECDQYNVLGNITACDTTMNTYTNERLYQLTVECNDIPLDICINEKNLMGIPEVGRRFKGVIWLLGRVNF